ncbi:hypothetical protein BSL78_18719 [Apostichopus japonicus]|uniref:RRM domain-containing protein n=1 Tax=Stichopus japonicus TaxID=307972 RepID=A0A2G8K8X4_STIJA|nr:hypothetical protein BSL78_18719 [Apostichopus japonicus]
METTTLEHEESTMEAEDDESSGDDANDEVAANPYQYDLHIQLITVLRKEGEFDKLCKAREDMSAIFPLTDRLWLDWIEDERKFTEDGKSREKIEKLFDRAVQDYLSDQLWLEYAQFSVGGMNLPGGVEKIREVNERAISAVGLHWRKGNAIWELYRECENAFLTTIQPPPGSVVTKEKSDEVDAQVERINKIFKRQLRVPLQDMEETLKEYQEWLCELAGEDVMINYKIALAKVQKYKPYESALVNTHGSNLAEWQSYLTFIVKDGEPATVRCCFERAVAEHCLATDLWLDYTQYLDSHSTVADLHLSVYNRSVRNCPWSPTLWKGYMQALEHHQRPHETIKETFEKSLLGGFTESSDFLGLWESYIDYMRRRLDHLKDTASETDFSDAKEELKATIEKAAEYLGQYFGSSADPTFRLQQYQAVLEAKYFQNMEKCRELWNEILSAGNSSHAHMWMAYYNLERIYGDTKHCRKILNRAVNAVSDWPEQVCETLLMFERLEGTLDTLQTSRRRVESQMKRVEERREKERAADSWKGKTSGQDEEDLRSNGEGKEEEAGRRGREGGGRAEGGQRRDYSYFVKAGSSENKEEDGDTRGRKWQREERHKGGHMRQESRKESKDEQQQQQQQQQKQQPENIALKRKADSPTEAEDQSKKLKQEDTGVFKVPTSRPPKSPKSPKSVNFTPLGVPAKGTEDVQQLTSSDGDDVKGEPMETEMVPQKSFQERKLDPDKETQEKTVFVKNLSYDVEEAKLKEIFSKCGEIQEVRLVTNYQQKSRGFGYVEFTDSESVAKALALDRESIAGRPMYVDRYVEKERDREKKPTAVVKEFKYEMKLEKNKLFVSNLPRSATKEELEKLFSQHGTLKEVRMVTYRSGMPKGLAFVEFENEADASKAIMGTDGTDLAGHSISVAISNPPSRRQPISDRKGKDSEDAPSHYPKSLGAKGISGPRGKGRTQLFLVPRALQKTSSVTSEAKPEEEKSTEKMEEVAPQKKMNNAEFAKMFLKK